MNKTHTINVRLGQPPAAAAVTTQEVSVGTAILREQQELRRLRSLAAERPLDKYEQGRFEVLTADEQNRNSIIYSRDGRYMWVPLSRIGPYLNRLG